MGSRLGVRKTYKMLVGGAFVRSESGRSLEQPGLGQYCRASRKDVRDAVKSARAAFGGWSGKTAYNRAQIVYRMAEMLEARSAEFGAVGATGAEVSAAVDRLVHFAGWADKFVQQSGSVNPVAGPYFDFSVPEPTGVVGIVVPDGTGLLGLVTALAAALSAGNTVVLVAADDAPILACEFAEVVATSDVPGGVVNVLTGQREETVPILASHMDVNALDVQRPAGAPDGYGLDWVVAGAENLKRVRIHGPADLAKLTSAQSLAWIESFTETKTVWHPIGL
jgi:acyl-CoA reductase-like NAD-dependent aldehyde dehydrogenase